MGVSTFLYMLGANKFIFKQVCGYTDPEGRAIEEHLGNKGLKMICMPVVEMVIFWFCGSIAWAVKLARIKESMSGQWIFEDARSLCHKEANGTYSINDVQNCTVLDTGSFGPANASVTFGFFTWLQSCLIITEKSGETAIETNVPKLRVLISVDPA